MDRWEYLSVNPFDVRYVIAEHFVSDFPEVVDVGTYKRELNLKKKLWCVDPLGSTDGFRGTVAEFWREFNPSGPYGVVCLGFDLQGGQAEVDAMVELCQGADRLVLEWATEYEQPVIAPSFLVDRRRLLADIHLDLTAPNVPGHPVYSLRQLQVWE